MISARADARDCTATETAETIGLQPLQPGALVISALFASVLKVLSQLNACRSKDRAPTEPHDASR
jgi:hypothetical protein